MTFLYGDDPVIPHLRDEILEAYTGKPALRCERDKNLIVKSFAFIQFSIHTGAGKIKFKTPCPVKVHPFIPDKLWTRVFRSRDRHGIRCSQPGCRTQENQQKTQIPCLHCMLFYCYAVKEIQFAVIYEFEYEFTEKGVLPCEPCSGELLRIVLVE